MATTKWKIQGNNDHARASLVYLSMYIHKHGNAWCACFVCLCCVIELKSIKHRFITIQTGRQNNKREIKFFIWVECYGFVRYW